MKHDSKHPPIQSAEAIAALIDRYRTGGLALKDFARQAGLPAGRLHYWLYQKHRASAVKGSPRRWGLAPPPVFQEVKLVTDAPLVAGWAAEVSLPRGVTVRFSATVPSGWIGAVVQALQRPC